MILIIVLVGLSAVLAQVSHDPLSLQTSPVRFAQKVKTVPSQTAFKMDFPALGYQIGGTVYETHKGLLDDQLFDKQYYNQSQSCKFYRSQLKLNVIQDITLTEGLTLQAVAFSPKLGTVFAIVSDGSYSQSQTSVHRNLASYSFNSTSLAEKPHNIPVADLGLNSSESLDIQILMFGPHLLVTDGVKIIAVDPQNFLNHWPLELNTKGSKAYDYDFAAANDLINFRLCHYDQVKDNGIVVATWNTALRVYHISQKATEAILDQDFQPPANNQFTDAQPDFGRFWALAGGQLVAFRPDQEGKYSVDIVELQSAQCNAINKYESTLHVICEEGGLNYVAQYFLNESFQKPEEALRLNRYFTSIDDAKLLFRFGGDYNPKLIISGDNELLMVPYAVNRQALIDSSSPPKYTRIRSLGVQLIQSLQGLSNFTHNYAIGVGEGFLALFMVEEEAPEMECFLRRTSEDVRWNILVELNTSSCMANGDWEQLQSICNYLIPMTLYASLVEVDEANHSTIVATVILLLLAVGIVVVGCGLYCKTNLQKAAAEVRKRLAALQKKKSQMKPL